jgi:ribosomal protein L33
MREKIKLNSTGLNKEGRKTGYYRTTTKNKKSTTENLKLKCFDPFAYDSKTGKFGMHVLFEEGKV